MSLNAGAECVDATGVGSAVASCSNDVADAGCEAASEGGADSSSDKVSVCPGVVATRATKAARALVLPVVDSEDKATVAEVAAAGVVVAAEGAAGADEAPDVGDVVGANEPPGLAGRGGAFATGGGEAGGAGRAGGTVGMGDLDAVLGDVAVRADVAEVAPGAVAAVGVVADAPDADVLEVGVPDAAGDPEGRLASVVVVEAGLVADPAAEVEAAGADVAVPGTEAAPDPRVIPGAEGVAPVFADGAAARGAPPAWAGCEDVGFDATVDLFEVGGVVSDATAVADLRATAAAADDPDAGAEVVGDGADEAEVGVAGAAARVGGIGASPDPRSAASSIGDAQVPEYALSVDVDAHDPDDVEAAPELLETVESDVCVTGAVEPADEGPEAVATVGLDACPDVAAGMVGIPNPAGDFCVSAAVDALADALWGRANAGVADPVPWAAAAASGASVAACDDVGAAAVGACLAADALGEIGVGAAGTDVEDRAEADD
jgi:hypothetical protein